ncbi:MAG: spermidine/putrescine ABC transporter substrate-binding protein, partial [Ilumatobacteraceae bacterium]
MKLKKRALASALSAAALIVASCGGDGDAADVEINVPDIAMHQEMGEFEGELNIVNWSGFVEPAWTDKFTADTGCKVNPRVAGTSDEMVTLMRTGQYDIVSASGDAAL